MSFFKVLVFIEHKLQRQFFCLCYFTKTKVKNAHFLATADSSSPTTGIKDNLKTMLCTMGVFDK